MTRAQHCLIFQGHGPKVKDIICLTLLLNIVYTIMTIHTEQFQLGPSNFLLIPLVHLSHCENLRLQSGSTPLPLADLGGGLQPPPPLWSEILPKKGHFWPFLGLRTEWWTKVITKGCNPPPLSISRPTCDSPPPPPPPTPAFRQWYYKREVLFLIHYSLTLLYKCLWSLFCFTPHRFPKCMLCPTPLSLVDN